MTVEIRPPKPSDADTLANLLTQLGYAAGASSIPDRLREFEKQRNAIMWVAEHEGRVVGLASAHVITSLHKAEPVAMLTVLVVHENARGLGIGRQLVAKAEDWARAQGATGISLTSATRRADAHAFYQALGYEQTGVRLAKPLP